MAGAIGVGVVTGFFDWNAMFGYGSVLVVGILGKWGWGKFSAWHARAGTDSSYGQFGGGGGVPVGQSVVSKLSRVLKQAKDFMSLNLQGTNPVNQGLSNVVSGTGTITTVAQMN